MNLKIFFTPELDILQAPYHRMPTLEKIIGMSRIEQIHKSTEALVCEYLQLDAAASAPIALAQRLGEGLLSDGNWLIATPVHLLLQRDTFGLLHPSEIKLDKAEMETLISTLNRHFAQDGMHFEISPGGRCYLFLPNQLNLETSSPYLAAGQPVDPHLPRGEDAGLLNSVLNEIQMLLFDHPVNQAREARGELAVNGFWLHGEGVSAPLPVFANTMLVADHPFAAGLAQLANVPIQPLSGFGSAFRGEASYLVMLGDADDLDKSWFVPALKALRRLRLQSMEVFVTANGRTLKASINPLASLKFWSAPRSLESIFYHD